MLYILTAVHNRYEITKEFINNLKKQTFQDYTLVLVDDGSTDGTEDMVKENMPDSVILKGDGNLWWGGGLHKGYKWLKKNAKKDDIVLICNDDTYYEENFLEKGVILLGEQDSYVLTACGYSVRSGNLIDGAVMFNYSTGTSIVLEPGKEGNCASTRSIFIPWEVFKKTGGFHPILLPHYASDYEFTMRMYRKGFKIKSDAELCYKYDEETTGIKDKSKLTLKKIFSKRSMFNPIYKISFILLATPIKHMPSHLKNQMKRYAKQLKK